ncbi:cytochrome P450 3A41-like [Tubulanus polymorphus]|uniref:cytochrome P450 3A41-like n=1 Tax=Tubulanus polymorphus TaxID=672921 RepID=UPI003DA5636B
MTKKSSSFINKNENNLRLDDSSIFGIDNVLSKLSGDHWKHVRSLLTPTFSTGKLRKMNSLMEPSIKNLLEILGERAKKDQPVDMNELFARFSLDTIFSTMFGLQINSLKNANESIFMHAKQLFKTMQQKPRWMYLLGLLSLLKHFGYRTAPKESVDYFMDLINEDFLQLMVRAKIDDSETDRETRGFKWSKKGLLLEEILVQAFLFIFGFENISNTMTYVAYCLAVHPDVQEKLIKEIDGTVGDHKVSYDNINELKYMDMVVNECGRLHAVIFRHERLCNETTAVGDFVIQKGWDILVPVLAIHMDPDIWPEPEKFNPERFSAENSRGRHPSSYMPFGMGPRNCIAKRLALVKIKTAIASILQHFRFTPCVETQIPLIKNQLNQPTLPIKLKVEKRHDSKEVPELLDY